MTKYRILLLLSILIPLSLPTYVVFADIGPKPSMEFEFELLDGITITSGILYECDQSDCSDAAPMEELGPQRLACDSISCSAVAYGFAPYHRLEIQFSDGKTRSSNIFETIDFDSVYLVTINADDLSVEEVSGSPAPPYEDFPAEPNSTIYVVVGCVCILLLIGLITSAIIFFVRRSRKK
ncbi:MAG: hypothetical protein H7Y59_04295 [Anaerolineales bacterium]|nr:hypothetical protein [Anaerolineales bacterium]